MLEDENIKLSKAEKHIIYKIVIDSLRAVKYINLSKTPNDSVELYEAYIYTLKKHGFENSFDSQLNNPFYSLAKYDKINNHKKDPYLIKLNQLLKYLKQHIQFFEDMKNSLPNSTINTSYTNTKKYIAKDINDYNKSLDIHSKHSKKSNLSDDETYQSILKISKILKIYKEHPLFTSSWIQSSNNEKFDCITSEHKEELQKLNKQIFSYKLQLSKKDIVKSFQAYAIDIYHNESIQNQLMNNTKLITDKELVKLIGAISKKLLDEEISKPHVKNVDSIINYIDIVQNTLILQPTTTPTKRIKLTSYDDLLLKLS
jgi:hypothetical protein